MSTKTFVLDTNVLLQSPDALFAFDEHKVVIPEAVIEELDNFKKSTKEVGYTARTTIRYLDELREKGRLTQGVKLANGGLVVVEANHTEVQLPPTWDLHKPDNRILQVCYALQQKGEDVYLVTKDIIQRIKAEILEVSGEDFENERTVRLEKQYRGRRKIYIPKKSIDNFATAGLLDVAKIETVYASDSGKHIDFDASNLTVNEFVSLYCAEYPHNPPLLSRFNGQQLVELDYLNSHPYGVTPKNLGQIYFQEALMQPAKIAPLVLAKGPAGTAKTFYSLAVGLEKVYRPSLEKEYRRVLVCRPMVLTETIGALPGTERDKIDPLLRPVYDNLEILLSNKNEKYQSESLLRNKATDLFTDGLFDAQAIGFMRGRSLVEHYVIIDEAQNLTPTQAKSIATRAGSGTKIIMVGDPEQVDHPYLDSRTNGLSYIAERMKGSTACFQITFDISESVRSFLATEAAKRL